MTLLFIRVFYFILTAMTGYYIGTMVNAPQLGLEIGLLGALILIFLEQRMHNVSVRGLSSMVFGLLLGLFMAKLVSNILGLLPLGDFIHSVSEIVLNLVFSYLGAIMALRGKDEFNVIIPYVRFRRQDVHSKIILLDTSAIIDGRVGDIYRSNFLLGRLVVPKFVLQELQTLADSADDIKRQRGRRGLDILKELQKDTRLDLRIHEEEVSDDRGVDAKLVKLAKFLDATVCTVDFNLEKTATLQGIQVLNLNALAEAVRCVIFPGEYLEVTLVKEGKEHNQAIGYMQDGTMVVVSEGRNRIGQRVNTVVTSVLQTQSGKMVFGSIV
ncbi:MAG: twitching motility protein PilT [Candidatus Omnitrophica bacterium]|nr:twitching motility protein PilT [Candidatus Omnitrophota bacterium]